MPEQWTIPLTITVSLGASAAPGPSVTAPPAVAEGGRGDDSIPYLDQFSIPWLTSPSFNWRTALSLALASRLAYETKGVVEHTATKLWKLANCEFVEVDDTQCFIASTSAVTLISFRGTENLGDWLSNLNSIGTTRSYGGVHRGFLGAFQVVQSRLEAILGGAPNRPVVLTGHSLGGALAIIAAAEWKGKFRVARVHTFGQPAVGKEDFRDFVGRNYADCYHRFVNDDDLVPMVPPWFTHCGSLVHFNRDGDLENTIKSPELESLGIEIGPIPEETPMMSETEFALLRSRLLQEKASRGGAPMGERAVAEAAMESAGLEGFFPSVADHKMVRYIEKIARKAQV
jgi:hypothetical protein